jgi:Protein of unknown function (DUF2680)
VRSLLKFKFSPVFTLKFTDPSIKLHKFFISEGYHKDNSSKDACPNNKILLMLIGVNEMKKILLVGVVAFVVIAALGFAGLASAQSPTPPTPQTPYGPGMMGRGRMGPGGMWGQQNDGQYGPMHEYMEEALAKAMDVDVDELETALADGKTMWQFAQEKGLSLEAFQQAMLDARKDAISKMVEDGVITKEQGDWMLNRMQNGWGQGGTGGCPGMGGGFNGRGGRWSNPGAQPSGNPPTTNF